MQAGDITIDPTDRLNVLEQQPGLYKLYTQLCFCFSVADGSSYPAIIHNLKAGLERLSMRFPWIAGQVVNEGSSNGNSGIYRIMPLETIPRLVVKDLRSNPSVPIMDDLRQARFPFNMLDEGTIAPCSTLPGIIDGVAADSAPVLLLQATFISGGLLITINGQHNTMDMAGQAHIIHLLSKACSNEGFTEEESSSVNIARYNLIPLLDDSYTPGPELAHQLVQPTPPVLTSEGPTIGDPSPSSEAPKCIWTYFAFSLTALNAIKDLATRSLPSRSPSASPSFISTDDALTAFIWQSVLRARSSRLKTIATQEVKLARAVDVRRYFPHISPSYPGLLQNMTFHTYANPQDLLSIPLGSVASNLRSAIDPQTSTLEYDTRALATVLDRAKDKSGISLTASLELEKDLMLSSWSKFAGLWDLEFGLGLGKPECVRRPQFTPVESLIYIMPKAPNGEIVVGMCLREEDLMRLRKDDEWVRYAEYVG